MLFAEVLVPLDSGLSTDAALALCFATESVNALAGEFGCYFFGHSERIVN